MANLDIQTNIQNARQTIQRVTITSNWTDAGTKLIDFNNDASKIFISTAILNAQTSFSGNVLWLNADGELIYVPSSGLIVSWATYSNTPWWTGNDTYWTGSLDDIRNTNIGNVNIGAGTATGRLYVWSTADTQLVLKEENAGSASNMRFQNTANTRKIWGNANYFYMARDNEDTAFHITSWGNIGIWLTSYAWYKLDVNGNINIRENGGLYLSNSANPYIMKTPQSRYGNPTDPRTVVFNYEWTVVSGTAIAWDFVSISAWRWWSIPNTWWHLYVDWNLGVGTNNPSNKLHVVGTGQFDHLKITALTNTCLWADGAWNVVGTGCGSTSTSTWSSLWTAAANGIYYNSWKVSIWTSTIPNTVTDSSGNVITPTVYINGNLVITGASSGFVFSNGYWFLSDKRLKKNISPIASALEKINALNGYMFTWRSNDRNDMWVIAQEVETVFPEIVNTDIAGYKSVEYGNLVAPLIEAIKELSKKVEQQAKEIEQLKNR